MASTGFTEMGGANPRFGQTQWDTIDAARDAATPAGRDALNDLTQRYWKPIYAFFRAKGLDNEDAKDHTQNFMAVGFPGVLAGADPRKGRFRNYLLAVLQNYQISAHRKATALKRRPRNGLQSIEGPDGPLPIPDTNGDEARAFLRQIAVDILDDTIRACRLYYAGRTQQRNWDAFALRELEPHLRGAVPPDLPDVCELYGFENPGQASNAIQTVKRRFRDEIRRQIAARGAATEDIDEEIREVMAALAGHQTR